MRAHLLWLIPALALSTLAEDRHPYTFGTTVVDSSGLEGRVFHLKEGTTELPKLSRMRPVGTVYTTALSIWPQHFDAGFPNITDRFEWFAIEYTGRIWIEKPGCYKWSLLADDGARLYLNDKLIIDNDGVHRAVALSGGATLTRGVHEIKVEYFQGPRLTVALVLAVAPPDEPWRLFSTSDFKPPLDTALWENGRVSQVLPPTM